MNNPSIHLICNAHLDPVWLWEWEEGAAEAISTFRSAAELCENNDTFVFNHNEVTLYKWVQEYEPSLFRRIHNLVKQGKWHIMGGWYLQPDCNMPSGESFVRQILLGKSYFKKHFGVDPKTAINFDPFGHSRGLVQILAKSGYDSYLFGRPTPEWLDLPGEDFIWQGFDGSEVLASRFHSWYNSPLGQAREFIEARIASGKGREPLAILWGMGNHGGGPSKKDLRNINSLIKQSQYLDVKHSTPEDYFREIVRSKKKLPRFAKDLNHWAVGCYTSQVRIKQRHRLLENEFYVLEKMASSAWLNGVMKYPYEDIHEALCDLMNSQFHDILPGSSIESVERAALRQVDHGDEIISRLKARAFFALASGQKKARDGEIPIMVYNPHPYKVNDVIECEFNLPNLKSRDTYARIDVYQDGVLIDSQEEQEKCSMRDEWRKRVVFGCDLKPSQMNRFECKLRIIPKKPVAKLKVRNGKISFTTKELDIVINARTGLMDRYRANGVNYLGKDSFRPMVMKDNQDSWGMEVSSFRNKAGAFKLMSKKKGSEFSGIEDTTIDSVRIIEDGPVRSVVEVVMAYDKSFICQHYKLPKKGTRIEVETRVHWNQSDKMLKLSVSVLGKEFKYIGQTAYGIHDLYADGTECVSQKWSALVSRADNKAITCIDDGVYGSDFCENELRLTLLRSAAYSAHPHLGIVFIRKDRFTARMDQGVRTFNFWFDAGKVGDRLNKIDREALVKNEKPFALSFFPCGFGKKPKPLAVLSDKVVQIATIKRAENNNDIIVRLFEPTGRKRKTVLTLPVIGKKVSVKLAGFEIKTLRINSQSGKYTEVDLLEKKI